MYIDDIVLDVKIIYRFLKSYFTNQIKRPFFL